MIYIRSLIAGTMAMIMAAALSPIIMGVYFIVIYRQGKGQAIGWDPAFCAREPVIWAVALLVFIGGFVWEFRHRNPN